MQSRREGPDRAERHPPTGVWPRCLVPLLLIASLAACGGRPVPRTGAGGVSIYRAPGPPSDPWGPYIDEASRRFDVPSGWVRAVIRQESGGHEYLHGQPITSDAGAMGLMQLMPPTYAELADRYGLGADPYEPHDNIAAGTGYIHELYARYGFPAFLAAYDAGPHRLDAYLAGQGGLPNETVNYLASVAPVIAHDRPLTGPLAAYADGGEAAPPPALRAYASAPAARCWQDPDAAYDPDAPCRSAPARGPTPQGSFPPAFLLASTSPPAGLPAVHPTGEWAIQVGAFQDAELARRTAESVRSLAPRELGGAQAVLGTTTPFGGRVLYRARLFGLSAQMADRACTHLSAQAQPCVTIAPGS